MSAEESLHEGELDPTDKEMYEVGGDDVDVDDDDVSDGDHPSWSSLTVAALKAALVERGLQTTGRKADLVARLEASQSGAEEQSEDVLQSEQSQDVLQPEDVSTDKADESCEPELTCAVETTDADDDNDEFVEWNEGDDEVKNTEADLLKVEVVDEVKTSEAEDHGSKTDEKVDTSAVDEENIKNDEQGGELSVNLDKDKDVFYVVWQSKKITIPFREEITSDMEIYSRMQTIVIYPLTLADIYSDAVRKQTESASTVELTLEDTIPGQPPKGYLKLKFSEIPQAKRCVDELQDFREGVTVKQFTKDDSESHIMSKLRKDDCDRRGPTLYRLLYVGNLSADITESTLREHFPEALQVIMPCNEETSERLGYAFLECLNEKTAYELSEKYKDAEINGEKLYVIQAISEKKDKFGLLRDSLRMFWSEQAYRLQKIIDKPHGKAKWEISETEQKLQVLTRRLDRDKRRREVLHLPCPEYVPTKEDIEEKEKDDKSSAKKDDRGSKERRSYRDRRSPRRSPARRSNRGQGNRNMAANFPNRREDVADKLVNQLQGLVSALTHKLPTVEPPRPLLEDLQFGPLANFQRSLAGANFAGGLRGTQSYGTNFSGMDTSARYSSGKRYGDDDQYGGDRKRRQGNYGESTSASRYGGGANSGQGAGRQFNRSKF